MRPILQLACVALLAAVWLPMSFLGRSHVLLNPPESRYSWDHAVVPAYSAQLPYESVQFHQFRSFGFQCWFIKNLGLGLAGSGRLLDFIDWGVPGTGLRAPCSSTLVQTWQFSHRTALPPRAPCIA